MDDIYGDTAHERSGIFWDVRDREFAPDGVIAYSDFASPSRSWWAGRPFLPEGWYEEAELRGPAQRSGNLRAHPVGQVDLEASGLEFYPRQGGAGLPATPTIAVEDEVYA